MSRRRITPDHCDIHVSEWERANACRWEKVVAEVIRKGEGRAHQFRSIHRGHIGPGVEAFPVAQSRLAGRP